MPLAERPNHNVCQYRLSVPPRFSWPALLKVRLHYYARAAPPVDIRQHRSRCLLCPRSLAIGGLRMSHPDRRSAAGHYCPAVAVPLLPVTMVARYPGMCRTRCAQSKASRESHAS